MSWTSSEINRFLSSRLATTITLDDGSISGVEIKGIFKNNFELVNQFDGRIESSGPVIKCATADVSSVEHNQALWANNKDYVITGIQNDGTGWTRLFLRERFD